MLQPRHAVHRGETLGIEQHQLAPMTQDYLKARQAIEDAGEDKTQKLQSRVVMPAQAISAKAASSSGEKPE